MQPINFNVITQQYVPWLFIKNCIIILNKNTKKRTLNILKNNNPYVVENTNRIHFLNVLGIKKQLVFG